MLQTRWDDEIGIAAASSENFYMQRDSHVGFHHINFGAGSSGKGDINLEAAVNCRVEQTELKKGRYSS